ncbi:UDP-N-acetylmuramoyl-L-alanine--D-glutamate ligase [Weissella paramesenteroides]|uniref:UDP-N-acetylmuramoyl-L-alanine--D-glutamate ligase n=1 Tax=Weissella paramesenteroides TaxID=1249 RepID=UPI003F20C429
MDKHVLIIGFARSGAAAANLLQSEGTQVIVSDPKLDITDKKVVTLKAKGVQFTTDQSVSLLHDIDLIVKNPGIPYTIPVLTAAEERHIPIVVEVALAQKYIQENWIAVTGSNGKTTTTEMIASVLRTQTGDGHVLVAGNIGTPVSEVAPKILKDDVLVTELSSFQLTGMPAPKPHIAVLTNIFASHLNFHGTRENYVAAKMNITKHQTAADFFVVNYDNEEWRHLAEQTNATIVPFSRKGVSQAGAYLKNGSLYYKEEFIIAADELGVPGTHNIENALAAIAVGKLMSVETTNIAGALRNFSGVEHRLQFIGNFYDRPVYNDSKATDIEATEMALSGFNVPVILLAGGLDRGDDQMRLLSAMKQHVKGLIVFGETAEKLAAVGKKIGIPVLYAKDAPSAVKPAFELSEAGEVILLSPAAASWDQFPDFETRGNLFVDAVKKFKF